MGVIGGLFGTSFVLVNKKITILRAKLQMSKGAKAIEAALIGMFLGGNSGLYLPPDISNSNRQS